MGGEDLVAIHRNNVGATDFVVGGLGCGEYLGSTAVALDVRNISTLGKLVSLDSETKCGVGALDFHGFGEGMGERIEREVELINGAFSRFCRKGVTLLGPLEVHNIWRDVFLWEVIHTFIKTSMFGNLDSLGFWVVPYNIFGGVGEETEEDAFAGVGAELDWTASRWAHPDSATKSAEVREIVLFSSGKLQRGGRLILGGNGIVNAEPMVEGIGPEFDVKIGTYEH